METILVPVDFSKSSLNALKYAETMAHKISAAIILINASDSEEPITTPVGNIDELLRMQCNEITASGKIRCSYVSLLGDPVDAIVKIADSKNVDLIIMGTHEHNGIREKFTAKSTERVIEKSPCPVIAVPENVSFEDIQKITYATDYHESDLDGLKLLSDLAKAFTAEICIVHIADGEYTNDAEDLFINQFVRKVTSSLEYENISFKVIYGKNVVEKLNELVDKKETNLLVMSTRKKNLIGKLFGISFTQKIVHHLHIPLMAFHHKEEPIYLI